MELFNFSNLVTINNYLHIFHEEEFHNAWRSHFDNWIFVNTICSGE
jgi:hypothetical protein